MRMSNVNKPIIPAEIADAIEKARSHRWDNERIAYFVVNPDPTATGIAALRSIPFDTLPAALVNGYERELTPHEKIRERYEWEVPTTSEQFWSDGYVSGMLFTLNTLGIKIEGVNA